MLSQVPQNDDAVPRVVCVGDGSQGLPVRREGKGPAPDLIVKQLCPREYVSHVKAVGRISTKKRVAARCKRHLAPEPVFVNEAGYLPTACTIPNMHLRRSSARFHRALGRGTSSEADV